MLTLLRVADAAKGNTLKIGCLRPDSVTVTALEGTLIVASAGNETGSHLAKADAGFQLETLSLPNKTMSPTPRLNNVSIVLEKTFMRNGGGSKRTIA